MKVDTWCNVVLPEGKRARGRLVEHNGELLLLEAGPRVRSFGELVDFDLRAKTATTAEGGIRWTATCSCGWPTSLKGPVENILAKLEAKK